MIHTDSRIVTVPIGESSLAALDACVARAKGDDPFRRVVVIADHVDVGSAVRHHLGASSLLNVSVQTGRMLASELAAPMFRDNSNRDGRKHRPLSPLREHLAVRQVSEEVMAQHDFQPAGRSRMIRSLADAFRRMQERPLGDGEQDAAQDMTRVGEGLLKRFLDLVHEWHCYTPAELPHKAAEALERRLPPEHTVPHVIYYLPRRLSEGDLRLAHALSERDRCELILGITGDQKADRPVQEILCRLNEIISGDITAVSDITHANPLQRIADDGCISIISAPDPAEEVRTAIRSISVEKTPFHRAAIIYRQDNPYATLLRQELDAAGIPYSGTERRSLASTPSGLLLLGIVDLALGVIYEDTIDRERLIELMTSTAMKYPSNNRDDDRSFRPVPASRWATLARDAHADGSQKQWRRRLQAYLDNEKILAMESDSRHPGLQRMERDIPELLRFLCELDSALEALVGESWQITIKGLRRMLDHYRMDTGAESQDDRRRIEELLDSMQSLDELGYELNPQLLREVIHNGTQSPVSNRGRPVGAGVYLGPPAGVVGADYDTVYLLGMVERQFPPRPGTNPWIGGSLSSTQHEMSLERYDFLGGIAAAQKAVLFWPAATAERTSAYPSRWLMEAANLLHAGAESGERLTYENLNENSAGKRWLTVIPSREAGLRELPASKSRMEPADRADYNLMHLVTLPDTDDADLKSLQLESHPAVASDSRMRNALKARSDRFGDKLTKWDGRVGADSSRIAGIGSVQYPLSPSALEDWATCPYKFFLSRILRLSSPSDTEEGEISSLNRGSLVHRILERFVNERGSTEEKLLELAHEEFGSAEERGITGHHLLWEIERRRILDALKTFYRQDVEWLGGATAESVAELDFGSESEIGSVVVSVEGLGDVSFRGKIDRVDVRDGEVRVRDFKTGNPDSYQGKNPKRTVANGRAMQLPIYLEAARSMHPDKPITASYCFPLADKDNHDVAPYTAENEEEFLTTLGLIIGMSREGTFPATPEQASGGWGGNCRYCDFKSLCPARKRLFWERKGRNDPALQPFSKLQNPAAVVEPEEENA